MFLGDAYVWRRVCLATRMFGDAYVWRRLSSLRVFVLYLFTPWSYTSSGKKIKTEARFFLNFFSFIWVTSLKNPEREKECPLQ